MKTNKLVEFLKTVEWYDNSSTAHLINCARKGYYNKHLAGGLKMAVGTGADFGTCIHAGVGAYYAWWGRASQMERRRHAFRVFADVYGRLFPPAIIDTLETKHAFANGLLILDDYFNKHIGTDETLRPIEVEMGGAVEIAPRKGEDWFAPFWWVFRIDGLHQRTNYGDYYIRELKTTSGRAERRLMSLKIDRQSLGYLYCIRQFPDVEVVGVLGDVVLVAAKTLDARRDYFVKTQAATESWRRQTIYIIERWRELARQAKGKDLHQILDIYTQNTEQCLQYGMCHYYDLCEFGVSATTLAPYVANDWNPLADYDFGMTDQAVEFVSDHAIKETHKVADPN